MRGSGAGAAALTRVQELLGQWAEISGRSAGMSSGQSVLDKAQAMTAEASRLRQGEKADAGRGPCLPACR